MPIFAASYGYVLNSKIPASSTYEIRVKEPFFNKNLTFIK